LFGEAYSGRNVIYRERGVNGLDVQRAADTLLRLGQKPSIAALREQMGDGSPNTIGPLLEKYGKSLGHRIQAGPEQLERVPESLARLTEALWLRAIDEARQRVKEPALDKTPQYEVFEALENKVTELTSALAESRAQGRELQEHRSDVRELAGRRLAPRVRRKIAKKSVKLPKKQAAKKGQEKQRSASIGKRRKRGRTRLVRQGHR
jgi:hypothetical protein